VTSAIISDATEIHSKLQLVCKPSDWTWGGRSNHLRHVPTNTVFEIFPRHDLRTDDFPTPDDLGARLVHAPDGIAPLSDAGCEVFCGEAVVMAGFLFALARPAVVNPRISETEEDAVAF
jgi:hypothetical protein